MNHFKTLFTPDYCYWGRFIRVQACPTIPALVLIQHSSICCSRSIFQTVLSHQYSSMWCSRLAMGGPSAVACSYRRPHDPSSPTTNCLNKYRSESNTNTISFSKVATLLVTRHTCSVLSNQRLPLLEYVPPPCRIWAALRLAYLQDKIQKHEIQIK